MTNTELKERIELLIMELDELPQLGVTLKAIRQHLIASKIKADNLIRDEKIIAQQTFKNDSIEPKERPIKVIKDNIKKPRK